MGIRSCLPSFTFKNVERALVAGLAVQGFCMGGFALAIMEVGSYWFGRKFVIDDAPIQMPLYGGDPTRLDVSARLKVPAKSPTKIIWKDNSCFCSSALWSFFSSQRAVLGELPEAISRRLNAKELCSLQHLQPTPEQTEPLSNILEIVSQKTPITLANFNQLRKCLQRFEIVGFPVGVDVPNMKALLSLLELHGLIREYQKGKPMSGERVNSLREMVYRVDSSFKDRGSLIGDAHEVIQPLAHLIFKGSKFEQNLHTTRANEWEDSLFETRRNWGDLALPMPIVAGQKKKLQSILEDYLAPLEPVKIRLGPEHTLHSLRETNQFDTAPELLALTLKRGDISMEQDVDFKSKGFGGLQAVSKMNMDEVDVSEDLELAARFCKDGRKGRYKLTAISRHRGNFAHYDAISKGPRGGWSHCDDLQKDLSVSGFKASDIPKYAQTGYMFFFSKV
jgi:hypothetical protein